MKATNNRWSNQLTFDTALKIALDSELMNRVHDKAKEFATNEIAFTNWMEWVVLNEIKDKTDTISYAQISKYFWLDSEEYWRWHTGGQGGHYE